MKKRYYVLMSGFEVIFKSRSDFGSECLKQVQYYKYLYKDVYVLYFGRTYDEEKLKQLFGGE